MTTTSKELIHDLIERTNENLLQAQRFTSFNPQELNWKPAADSWSILECLEHLNLYGDFYIPEIKNCIAKTATTPSAKFTSGILGNYFAKSMLPKENLNKMKTFSDKNPLGSTLDKTTITRFINQQNQLLALLTKSEEINLNKTKTAISISKWIKLKLGDTFRVVVYHNERHIAQANRVVQHQK